MDLDEWEILPRTGFVDYHEDDEKKHLGATKNTSNFNMNYFVCPSSPPSNSRNRIVPVPFQLEPPPPQMVQDHQGMKSEQPNKLPFVIIPEQIKIPDSSASKEADQDPVSQVFFKKMRENEGKFVDMKILESPVSPTSKASSFMPPQIEATNKFNFEDKTDAAAYKGETFDSAKITSPRIKNNEKVEEEEVDWEVNNGGLNLWKWSLNGIGAICSFGIAAATVCIIIFGSQQRNKHHHQHNQKLRFQIYTDDKRIKQVVNHATRLNEAITTVRGMPIARAHITYGGYYDGL